MIFYYEILPILASVYVAIVLYKDLNDYLYFHWVLRYIDFIFCFFMGYIFAGIPVLAIEGLIVFLYKKFITGG